MNCNMHNKRNLLKNKSCNRAVVHDTQVHAMDHEGQNSNMQCNEIRGAVKWTALRSKLNMQVWHTCQTDKYPQNIYNEGYTGEC